MFDARPVRGMRVRLVTVRRAPLRGSPSRAQVPLRRYSTGDWSGPGDCRKSGTADLSVGHMRFTFRHEFRTPTRRPYRTESSEAPIASGAERAQSLGRATNLNNGAGAELPILTTSSSIQVPG